jgi:Family of unknown function (DUF6326)
MTTPKASKPALADPRVNVKTRLAASWASPMFCYVYGDYFGLYAPGKITEISAGGIGPLGAATPSVLVGVAAMMAVPSLMVFLSMVLRPTANRWLNIALGIAYTAIMLMTMPGAQPFYLFLGAIEMVLTALIVWQAWAWPRQGDDRA